MSGSKTSEAELEQKLAAAENRIVQLEAERDRLKIRVDQYQQILDLLPEFIFGSDWDSQILIANKMCAEVFGLTVEQTVGSHWHDIHHADDRENFEQYTEQSRQVMRSGKPLHIPEMVVKDAQGNNRLVEAYRIPYTESGTGKQCILGWARDIAERKRIEAQLREKDRIERELDIARAIQCSLLPITTPDIPGFEIAGWSQAADKAGGDYFDWLTFPDGKTMISIADVTGHGIGSALLVAVCRAYFRASHQIGSSLEEVMSRVNGLLTGDLTEGRFVTAAVGVLYPATHHVQLSSAGHGPIFFYHADTNKVQAWGANGIPLGIGGDADIGPSRQIPFSKGDILVLATDGFWEWTDTNEQQFGTDRLKQFIQANHKLHPKNFIQNLHQAVLEFANGTQQADDLTAVVLKRSN